jgi:hypothetical protein
LHEYQKKRVAEFAFRNLLILQDAILVVLEWQRPKSLPGKRKAGTRSRTPCSVIYEGKYSMEYKKVKEKFAKKFMESAREIIPKKAWS